LFADGLIAAFEAHARTSAEEAASVIVEGIKRNRWRILIGQVRWAWMNCGVIILRITRRFYQRSGRRDWAQSGDAENGGKGTYSLYGVFLQERVRYF
jgi:hypothetical protein